MIGHEGHPEVEGTMGRLSEGIYLVEGRGRIAALQVARPDRLAVVTQTTLSVDDAAEILAAVSGASAACASPSSRTSATRRRTARMRSSCSARRSTWSSSSAARRARTATACANSPSGSAPTPTWSTPGGLARRMVRRQAPRRAHRGRVGADIPGATGHRPAARARRGVSAHAARAAGTVHFRCRWGWATSRWGAAETGSATVAGAPQAPPEQPAQTLRRDTAMPSSAFSKERRAPTMSTVMPSCRSMFMVSPTTAWRDRRRTPPRRRARRYAAISSG